MAKVSDILLFEHPDQHVLIITKEKLAIHEIADFIVEGFTKMTEHIRSIGCTTSEIPFVLYHNWRDMYKEPIDVSVVYPVAKPLEGNGDIVSTSIPGKFMVSAMYRGSYSQMHAVYNEMEKWACDNNWAVSGDCYEFYFNGSEFEEEDYLTRVMIPVHK